MKLSFLLSGLLLLAAAPVSAQDHCATPDDAKVIRNYYANVRPGAPPPAVGRLFRIPELSTVVTPRPARIAPIGPIACAMATPVARMLMGKLSPIKNNKAE